MAKDNTLVLEFMDDGTVKVIAKDMLGSEKQILDKLNALAKEIGGELVVEKHIESHHHHHHHDDKDHHHH
jgi:hypothetical protein